VIVNGNLHVPIGVFAVEERLERGLYLDQEFARLEGVFIYKKGQRLYWRYKGNVE
jgi:hypothetical protein